MNGSESTPTLSTREAAERGLAVVGFVALVALGIWLAVYSAQYVPATVNRLGAAAVALSSIFVPAEPTLTVVPTASTTISFGDGTTAVSSSTPATGTPAPITVPTPTPGQETNTVYTPNGTATALYGLPDLIVEIESVGYATSTNFDGFVASPTISASQMGAVKFAVRNTGTNVSGPWSFSASLPSNQITIYPSGMQPSLKPGDWIEFVLDFSFPRIGTSTVSVTTDPSNQVPESNEANNQASTTILVQY